MTSMDETGVRFEFGENWTRFLTILDDQRISEAERSLKEMLWLQNLEGLSFLDIGCGSGLFSLAARRLGARVVSFDFDAQSVTCTRELRCRYFPDDEGWRVEQGSVLDRRYMECLGRFDVVYSWGVLHHTGAMWLGLEHAIKCVAPDRGRLFIAIYNDQGWKSQVWWVIKYLYNRAPPVCRTPFVAVVSALVHAATIIKCTIQLKPSAAIAPLLSDRRERGMSARCDNVDWIGGFPYEVASPDELVAYCAKRNLALVKDKRTTSWGCNELSFQRVASAG